jgi:hypothetical protein
MKSSADEVVTCSKHSDRLTIVRWPSNAIARRRQMHLDNNDRGERRQRSSLVVSTPSLFQVATLSQRTLFQDSYYVDEIPKIRG